MGVDDQLCTGSSGRGDEPGKPGWKEQLDSPFWLGSKDLPHPRRVQVVLVSVALILKVNEARTRAGELWSKERSETSRFARSLFAQVRLGQRQEGRNVLIGALCNLQSSSGL